MIWDDFFVPNNLTENEHFFKYEFVRSIQETVGIDQSYDFDRQIEEYYFKPYMMGSFEKMAYGIVDVSFVFILCNRCTKSRRCIYIFFSLCSC